MEITELLRRINAGDGDAFNSVIPFVYDELKRLASSHVRREGNDSPVEATTLVHEAYMRLVAGKHPDYQSRAQFYFIASRVMRQILVDAARTRMAQKRGPGMSVQLADLGEFGSEPDQVMIAVNDALDRLAATSELKARLVEMRYFGGMTAEDIAAVESMSVHLVRKELRLAQAWLRRELALNDA